MNENQFRYQLIRYVPDLRRMEPRNIGVIVQGTSSVACKLYTRFRPLREKPDFDSANFKAWRDFFITEVDDPQTSIFRPERTSPEFLEYMQSCSRGNYIVSKPFAVTMDTADIKAVRDLLYEDLVKAPDEPQELAEQPVRRFREILTDKKIDNHPGFRNNEYVRLNRRQSVLFRWNYDRNHGSDEKVLIETVAWVPSIRETQSDMEHCENCVRKITNATQLDFKPKVLVVMDRPTIEMKAATRTLQTLHDNYNRTRDALARIGVTLVEDAEEATRLVETIGRDLGIQTVEHLAEVPIEQPKHQG